MLKKLFKYDWRSFWKVPTAICLFLAVITVIGVLSLVTPFWKQEGEIIGILMASAFMLYALSIMAGSVGVSIYTAIRFYKSVYTDEGYLTNTLPVTPRQLIVSKMLVGTVWRLITGAVVCLSMFALIITAFSTYEQMNILAEAADVFREASVMFKQELGISLESFIAFIIFYSIIGSFFSVLMMYSSVSLGQLFTTHKVMGAVIWYIAEYIIIQTGSSLVLNLPLGFGMFVFSDTADPALYITPVLVGSIIITVVLSVVMFFLSEYMLKKKLNLD